MNNVSSNNDTVIGPLPIAKTITITFVPDWDQYDMKSPLRAASVCVLLGPTKTLPQQAQWSFEFNLYATQELPSAVKLKAEESIGKEQRALLWYGGKPFPKYKNCVVFSKCRLPANDELKTHSIVLRTHGAENDPRALIWVPKRVGPTRRKEISYLKVVSGNKYHLNITFAADSSIAQLVGSQSWRPIIYLYAKRLKKGIDTIDSSRLFTNFTTNWAKGTEPNVDERELNLAAEALKKEADEDAEDNSMVEQLRRLANTPANPPSIAGVPIGAVKDSEDRPAENSRTIPTLFVNRIMHRAPPSAPLVSSAPLFHLQLPLIWSELADAIQSKPLASIRLPLLEDKPFKEDYLLDTRVHRFVTTEESTLSQVLSAIEGEVRTIAKDSKHSLSDFAKHLLNCFAAVSQLHGWIHVEAYIRNPQLYIEWTKANDNGETMLKMLQSIDGPITVLKIKGEKLIKQLYQRIDWVLELQRKAGQPFDPEFYVKVIAADRTWAEEVSGLMKEADDKITEMLNKDLTKANAFKELCRKGLQWPHSTELLSEIRRAGLVFRPTMIKRDRCLCEKCGEEVSGWRSWHNPWSFHNSAQHPPGFFPKSFKPWVAVTKQPPSSAVTLQPSSSSVSVSAVVNSSANFVPTYNTGSTNKNMNEDKSKNKNTNKNYIDEKNPDSSSSFFS